MHDSTSYDEAPQEEKNCFPDEWKGREIYEGDILGAWDNEGGGITGEVAYRDNAFCILTTTYKGEELQNARWIYAENFEVIGNIHDNPELLKGWK